jgi:gliding motility-associated-like protein
MKSLYLVVYFVIVSSYVALGADDFPTASFTATTVCQGVPTVFTNNSTTLSGSILASIWDFGDGRGSSVLNPEHIYSSSGNFSATLTVINSSGEVDDVAVLVTVHPAGNVGFVFNGGTQCVNNIFNFTNLSNVTYGNFVSTAWDFGDGAISTQNNPSHAYIAHGIYDVKLVQTTNNNCTSGGTLKVEVFPLPVTDFEGVNVCLGNSVSFLNTTQLPAGVSTFQWSFGDGTTSILDSPLKVFATSNTFAVSLIATSEHGCVALKSKNIIIHPAPVINFIVADHCLQSTAVFVNSTTISSGVISSFNWDFGNGSNSLLTNPVITYSTAGNYIVWLTAISNFGCEKSLSKNVNVYPKPAVDFTAQNECLGTTANFTNNSFIAGGALTYVWDFNDGASSVQTNPQHMYTLPRTFAVNLLATSTNGCTASVSHNHIVHPKPVADFTFPDHCQGITVQLNNKSSVVAGTLTYDWNFGDGNSSVTKNPNYLFNRHGNFDVALVVTSDQGCQHAKNKLVVVHALPMVDFSADNVCDRVATQFKNNTFISTDNLSYQWDFGDAGSSQLTNPSHLYTGPGDYQVTLNSNSSFGCSSTLTKTISVYALPIASFSLADVCAGAPVVTQNTSSITNGVISFQWDFGDGNSSTASSPTNNYSEYGNYDVKLNLVSDHGCIASTHRAVRVHPMPIADFNFSNVCVGTSVNLVNNSFIGQGSLAYQWNFADGTTSTSATPVKTYSDFGDYDINLTLSSSFGCVTSLTKRVSIYPIPAADFAIADHCLNTDAVFSNSSSIAQGTLSFEWDFGNGIISTDQNPVMRFDRPGKYPITLSTSSSQQCKSFKRRYIYVNALPSVDFSAKNVCEGDLVSFVNISSVGEGELISSWNFGDGTTSFLKSPEHLYDTHQTYSVDLTVTSSVGNCAASISRQIIVNEKPAAAFLATNECLGVPTKFTNQTLFSNNGIDYYWSFGNSISSQQKDPVMQYTTVQTFSVHLSAVSANGCADSFAANVTVFPNPVLNFQVENACDDTPLKFRNFSSINSGAVTYDWNFGDASNSLLFEPIHEYRTDGTYNVELTATSDKGCKIVDKKNIIIYPLPESSFNAQAVCAGEKTQFLNTSVMTSGFIKSILWDFGDGTNSIVSNPSKVFSNSGTYHTTLTSTSDKGCQSSFVRPVQVYVLPVANFSVKDVCLNEEVTFSNTSSISEGYINYSWDFGDGDFSNATTPSHLYRNSSVHVVSLFVKSNQGCKDSVARPVIIYAPPTVNAGEDQTISQGYSALLQANGATNYSWSPIIGLDNSTISNPMARPLETTQYTVTATDSRGCVGSDEIVLTVSEEFKISASNVLTPDGNGMNDTWKIENVETFGDVFVRVFDRWGNLVYEKEAYQNDWRGESQKDILPDGTYYYYITFGSSDKIYKGSLTLLRNK